MRSFTDAEGRRWSASVAEEDGPDYKGRLYLVFRPSDGGRNEGDRYGLRDVRWNSERTARRTIETMSVVELRRRLKAALGRGPITSVVVGP